jgi:hypothetical protein
VAFGLSPEPGVVVESVMPTASFMRCKYDRNAP